MEVILYRGQKSYRVDVLGLTRELPVVNVAEGVWIASNAELVLGDVEFIERVGKKLAERVRPFNPEVILTPEAKSIAIAYEVSKRLGHRKFVIARKSVKAYMKSYVCEGVKSITTKETQKLVLDDRSIEYIQGKRVCLLDDVVSTGGTMEAMKRLVSKVGGEAVCEAVVWKEGPWYKSESLIYLSTLPVFVSEEKFRQMVGRAEA